MIYFAGFGPCSGYITNLTGTSYGFGLLLVALLALAVARWLLKKSSIVAKIVGVCLFAVHVLPLLAGLFFAFQGLKPKDICGDSFAPAGVLFTVCSFITVLCYGAVLINGSLRAGKAQK